MHDIAGGNTEVTKEGAQYAEEGDESHGEWWEAEKQHGCCCHAGVDVPSIGDRMSVFILDIEY